MKSLTRELPQGFCTIWSSRSYGSCAPKGILTTSIPTVYVEVRRVGLVEGVASGRSPPPCSHALTPHVNPLNRASVSKHVQYTKSAGKSYPLRHACLPTSLCLPEKPEMENIIKNKHVKYMAVAIATGQMSRIHSMW